MTGTDVEGPQVVSQYLRAFGVSLKGEQMKLVGSDRGLTQIEVGNKVINRSKDGTFHVDGTAARALVRSGDFAVSGTTFTGARGYRCECGFVAVIKDKCGRCGSTELTPE